MLPAITLLARQREALTQALADAISYRDPPVYCAACDALGDTLCKQCAATFARARTYLALGREIGIEVSHVTHAARHAEEAPLS